jgi:HD superfamily phosphohydrolase
LTVLADNVNAVVEDSLRSHRPETIRAPKVIHDTVLGSNLFMPHEIAVLDLPLVQRLRRINQVDLVPLVFPSGNHNRFEHTLGVTVIADRLANALGRRLKGREPSPAVMDDNYINHLRMAAVLHDCGHGPFSHISEDVYRVYPAIHDEIASNTRLQGASPHEVLSFLIVTSPAFRDYFREHVQRPYHVEFDLDLVADMIVGRANTPKVAYLTDIINGAFDADKLDYIQRDSHFTGIRMVLDLERLFYTVDVIEDKSGRIRLSVDMSGVSTLEQIVFSKMLLFSTVYHHHKVRSAECLFRSIFERLMATGEGVHGVRIDGPASFLRLTDTDVYALSVGSADVTVAELARDLCLRRLPKRAMVISSKTVTPDTLPCLGDLMALYEKPDLIAQVRESIADRCKQAGQDVSRADIWVDIPSGPKFKEGKDWPIKSPESVGGFVRLRDMMPVEDWVRAFSENKWRGYVFTRPEYREPVFEATRATLRELFSIEVTPYSRVLCKMDEPTAGVEA